MTRIEIGFLKFKNKLNQIFPHNKRKFHISVILTAAGNGSRMGGVAKPLVPLNGLECIVYSLRVFQSCEEVSEIIITARESEKVMLEEICKRERLTKPCRVVIGGSSRQESVWNGFMAIQKSCDLVAIHDAARPLIDRASVLDVFRLAKRYGAACVASKVTDTVKRADSRGIITATVPRDELYCVQTPQVFKADLYRAAVAVAKRDGISVTDDCGLAEAAGFPVKLSVSHRCNQKLTTQDDVVTISKLLKED